MSTLTLSLICIRFTNDQGNLWSSQIFFVFQPWCNLGYIGRLLGNYENQTFHFRKVFFNYSKNYVFFYFDFEHNVLFTTDQDIFFEDQQYLYFYLDVRGVALDDFSATTSIKHSGAAQNHKTIPTLMRMMTMMLTMLMLLMLIIVIWVYFLLVRQRQRQRK